VLVVFLRAVNVGGHQVVRPSEIARRLARLEVTNIGAAGTFMVRAAVSAAAVRKAFAAALPFDTAIMTCTPGDLARLMRRDPGAGAARDPRVKRHVGVLGKRPGVRPRLPIRVPDDDRWQVSIVDVDGPFATSLQRRDGRTTVSVNEAIERRLGVPATTRGWDTLVKIHTLLTG